MSDMLMAVVTQTDDPRDLMTRVASGDAAAFTLLVEMLQGSALRIATRVLGSRSDAEDAVQAAMVKLWTEAYRFDANRGSVEGWFRRILVNVCLDRRRSVRPLQPIEEAVDVASIEPTPFEAAAGAARARRVEKAMASLNPRQRAAILLFHGEGASMAEIAATLDTTPKAVEGLLARARIELSVLLMNERAEL